MPLFKPFARLSTAALTTFLLLFASFASAQSGTLPAPSGVTGTTGNTGTTGGATPPPLKNNGVTPPPLPQLSYFVAIDGQPSGPFNTAKLKDLAANGSLTPQSLVWKEGMADWGPASAQADLQALLKPGAKPKTMPTKPASEAAAYLTGLWVVENGKMIVGAQQAVFSGNIHYKADGTSIGNVQMNTMGGGGQLPDTFEISATGTWKAEMQGPNQIKITSTDKVTFKSLISGNTQTMEATESEVYTIVNKTTMRDKFGNSFIKKQ